MKESKDIEDKIKRIYAKMQEIDWEYYDIPRKHGEIGFIIGATLGIEIAEEMFNGKE